VPTNKEILDLMEVAIEKGDMSAARELRDMYEARKATAPEPAPTQTEFTPEEAGYTPGMEDEAFYTEGPSQAVVETLSPLAQLEEGFTGSRDYRTERSLPEQAVRGLGSSALGLIRGAPELLAAGSEAAAGAAMDEPIRPERLFQGSPTSRLIEMMRPRARQAAEDIEETEREMYTASEPVPGEAWDAVLDDPSRLGRFIVEGIAGSAPHYLATLASPAGYAAALVGDIAKERARQRGDNKISGEDLTVAIPSAAAISGLNRAAQLAGLGGPAGQGIITAGIRNALAETVTEIPQSVIEVVGRQAGARPEGVSGEDVKQAVIGAATIAPVFGGVSGAAGSRMRPASPEVAPATEESVTPVTEGAVVPTEEVAAAADYIPRPSPREQVEADTDVAVRRVEADRALAEQVDAVPTRPRTGEVAPRTTQAQAQAELDQADVDVDTTASDPSASLADIVEKQARTAGLHSDANNASNEDTEAFLGELGYDSGQIKSIMSQERVPVSQALAELQTRDLHTRTPDDFTAKTTDPFDAMLDDIIATGRNADHVEKLAFGHAKIQHRRVYKNLLQQYDKAETQEERNSLSRKIDNVREASGKIAEANALAQRAWGLAGRYSQFFLDKDLTIVEALAKAKVDNKGLGLSAGQRAFIEKEYAVSDKLEARAKPIRQAAVKKMRALSRVIRRLEGKASPTKRDAKLLKEAKKRYDRAEGTVMIADHDVRAAKSIRLNAIDRSQTGAVLSVIDDTFDASRALRSSGEDSSLGRQGMNLLARSLFTKEQAWIKTIPPALKILAAAVVNNPAGRARAKRLQQELVNQPYQAVYDLVGGEIADVEGVGGRHGGTLDARQEEFATNLFNRMEGFNVPFVGRVEPGRRLGSQLVEPSQNAYALTLNMLRRDFFDRALKKRLDFSNIPTDLSATELVKAVKADPQLLADLESDAYMTNVFTGRGDWRIGTDVGSKGKGTKDIAARLSRRLMYAPRYMMSIIENSLRTIPSAALTGLLTRRSWTKPLRPSNYPEWFKGMKNREYDPKVLPLLMAGVGPFENVSDYQRGQLMGEAVFETAWLASIAGLAMIGFGDDDDEVSWWERLRRFNDPSDADYHKVVAGDYHVSLEGGRGATTRHLMPYKLTQSESDDIASVSGDVDWSRRIGRLLRNKTHPFVSSAISAVANEDYLGNQVTDMEWEEAKEDVYDLMTHIGQRSIPVALAFTPIISESMGSALGEGMAETGIPGVIPPDPSMADPDAPSLLNRLLITGGTNMFGIGAQYYDSESGDAKLPPELRKLLRSADPARALRPPSLP